MSQYEMHMGDCMAVMRRMPDRSIDAVITDPPYFRVKSEAWDRAWPDAEAFAAWIGELCKEWSRLLRPNGSIFVFASPQQAASVEVTIAKHFTVLNSLAWVKPNGRHLGCEVPSLRAFFPQTERMIFAEQIGSDLYAKGESTYDSKCDELRGVSFDPIRLYLVGERDRAGWTTKQVCAALGVTTASHYFSRSQWAMPTPQHYEAMRVALNSGKPDEFLRRDYESLRRDYESLRRDYESLRRPFTVSRDSQYTDVWTFAPVSKKVKHICEKPLPLMRHIVRSITAPDALILDCFAGSGATGHAALELGRRFVGIEMDPAWHKAAGERLRDVACQRQESFL